MAGQPSIQTPAGHARALSPADPSSEPRLEPLIDALLKTGVCVPNSLFLVEGVDAKVPISRLHRAVRLMLGDGRLCIQALLSPELHSLIDNENVCVGTYVRLVKSTLHCFKAGKLGGKPDRNSSDDGPKLVYLLVERMIPVGSSRSYLEAIKRSEELSENQRPPQLVEDVQVVHAGDASTGVKAPVSHADQDLSDGDDEFETMQVSQEKANTRRTQAGEMREAAARPGSAYGAAANQLPWASDDPAQPLKLTSLRSIPLLPYKQNWRVNVLAVVAQLSAVEPSHLPPYQQRVARLADPSTKKQVHLTVFLDPESFAPEEGSVVLLLGVKNHRFDGGSLKMYANERRPDGAAWWLENPTHLDWCDVQGLQRWWEKQEAVVAQDT